MALLVVVVVVLASVIVAFVRHPSAETIPLLGTAMGLLSATIGGLLMLLARGQNGNGKGTHILK